MTDDPIIQYILKPVVTRFDVCCRIAVLALVVTSFFEHMRARSWRAVARDNERQGRSR
jgi:hypothetical protein